MIFYASGNNVLNMVPEYLAPGCGVMLSYFYMTREKRRDNKVDHVRDTSASMFRRLVGHANKVKDPLHYTKIMQTKDEPTRDEIALQRSHCGSMFVDSGAHSLYNREADTGNKRGDQASLVDKYKFFDLKKGSDFRNFLEAYVQFIKENRHAIDFYVTLDAIYNPQRTWDITKCLREEYGLRPVPVIHYKCPLNFVDRYLEAGYSFLGVGGLGQGVTKSAFLPWADALFNYICPDPSRMPVVRTHGFAMTSWELLLRYPWYSVDSASWLKVAIYGNIYMPHKERGKFVFTRPPYIISASAESPRRKERNKHILNLSPKNQEILLEWLDQIQVPLGQKSASGEEIAWGITSNVQARAKVNLLYFIGLCEQLTFPRRFEQRIEAVNGFGLFDTDSTRRLAIKPKIAVKSGVVEPMRVYFSGVSGGGAFPEVLIRQAAPDVMLSFDNLHKQSDKSTAWRRLNAHKRNLQQ